MYIYNIWEVRAQEFPHMGAPINNGILEASGRPGMGSGGGEGELNRV